MTESLPTKETDFRPIVGILWIALITAVVVTIIDWKIKQDILRLTDAFYRVYPATLEREASGQAATNGLGNDSPVLLVSRVDDDSRMEEEAVPESVQSEAGRAETNGFRGFWEDLEESVSGTTGDSAGFSEESIQLPLGE